MCGALSIRAGSLTDYREAVVSTVCATVTLQSQKTEGEESVSEVYAINYLSLSLSRCVVVLLELQMFPLLLLWSWATACPNT